MGPYLDTSALAKWYLNEPFSEEFDEYIRLLGVGEISRLTVVELRCLVGRRRRAGDIERTVASKVAAAFDQDARNGFLRIHPVAEQCYTDAVDLIDSLRRIPLRTLDALHLAIARGLEVSELATADRTMASAARALGLKVKSFY